MSKALDKIFNATETEVTDFVNSFKAESTKFYAGLVSEEFDKPSNVEITFRSHTLAQGKIQIVHGWNGSDYIWHIGPLRDKFKWTLPIERVIYAMVVTLNEVLPREQRVDIFPPKEDWHILEVTLKALELNKVWFVDDNVIKKLNRKFLDNLNQIIQ